MDDNFLNDLDSDVFTAVDEKQQKKEMQENKACMIRMEKDEKSRARAMNLELKAIEKKEKKEKKTVTISPEQLTLMDKINHYKATFPSRLKAIKIKSTQSVDELTMALKEIESIVLVSEDSFILDSFIQLVRMVEGTTTNTDYDIKGLSQVLANNPEFVKLFKICLLKYGAVSKIPPEIQLVFIVGTSTILVLNANKGRHHINTYLNEPA